MPTLPPLLLNGGPSRLARRMTENIERDSDDEDYNPSSITHGSGDDEDEDEDEDETQDEDEDEDIVICTQFTIADERQSEDEEEDKEEERDEDKELDDSEDEDDPLLFSIPIEQWRSECRKVLDSAMREPTRLMSCTSQAKEYLRYWLESPQEWPIRFLQSELRATNTLGDVNIDSAAGNIWLLTMSIEPSIHRAIIEGNFTYRSRNDVDLEIALRELRKHTRDSPYQPRIYGNFLCHRDTGNHLSPNEMETLANGVSKYILNDAFANSIDNTQCSTSMDFSRSGMRRYLSTKNPTTRDLERPSFSRTRNLGVFIRAIEKRVSQVPPGQRDLPSQIGFSEFGYSDNISARLATHARNGPSSNYIMALLSVLSTKLLSPRIGFDQHVLYNIPCLQLVELAEIYFTRAGQGYIYNGGGAAHCPASRSTNSRHDYTPDEWNKIFDEAKPLIDANTQSYQLRIDTSQRLISAEINKIQTNTKESKQRIVEYNDLRKKQTELKAGELAVEREARDQTELVRRVVGELEELQSFLRSIDDIM